MDNYLICLGAGLLTSVASFLAIALLRRFWQWNRGMDSGDGVRKHQETPILRVGGLALFLAFVLAFLFSFVAARGGDDLPLAGPLLLFGSCFFLLGLLDDLYPIPSSVKFSAQIAIAVGAYLSGLRVETISHPMGEGAIQLGSFDLVFTVLWLVAIPNLVNLIDGMDGLAGGVGLFLTLTLGTIGLTSGNLALSVLSFGMAGGLVAFLLFNLPPAKIYMGDGGAYLLGFFIAGSALITSNKGSIIGPVLVVVIALGFPILDTALALVRRFLIGMPLMHPDARHLHHRLMTLGFSKRTVLLVLYGIFAGLSLLGLVVYFTGGHAIPAVGMLLVISTLVGLRFVGLPRTLSEARMAVRDALCARRDVRYAFSLARVLEHDLDRVESRDEYWKSLMGFLGKLGIRPARDDRFGIKVCPNGFCCIAFPLGADEVWMLCCPEPKGRRRQWDRVIRCFVPALTYGKAKWGAVPDEFGIVRKDASSDLAMFEASFNRPISESANLVLQWS